MQEQLTLAVAVVAVVPLELMVVQERVVLV